MSLSHPELVGGGQQPSESDLEFDEIPPDVLKDLGSILCKPAFVRVEKLNLTKFGIDVHSLTTI